MNCNFCFRHCNIPEGGRGFCKVRQVRAGKLVSINYGYLEALSVDPMEKKPLYHFLPGTRTLSVAEPGCNFSCDFCQNWQLSQEERAAGATFVAPQKLVDLAIEQQVPSISFTYSEPIVWQDYMLDCAVLAKAKGLRTVMVTNGSFSPETLPMISRLIDAFNIDLKGDENYYRTICKGELVPVLDGIAYLVAQKCHVEVTTLLVEGIHDAAMVSRLGKELYQRGVQVWHLSRFFPMYKMQDRHATSESFLADMLKVARGAGIPFVYGGNTSGTTATYCPSCHKMLASDHGYDGSAGLEFRKNLDASGHCVSCGAQIYGVFA
jgi:pyruvate formate lyase activating enzyme